MKCIKRKKSFLNKNGLHHGSTPLSDGPLLHKEVLKNVPKVSAACLLNKVAAEEKIKVFNNFVERIKVVGSKNQD